MEGWARLLLLWTIRNSLQKQVTLFKQRQREGSREAAPILPGGVLRWPRGQVRPGGEVTRGGQVAIGLALTSSSHFIHSCVRSGAHSPFPCPYSPLRSPPGAPISPPHGSLQGAPQEAGARLGRTRSLTQCLALGEAHGRISK